MRIGNGYDVHRMVHGRPLVLGGVHVPFESGLEGHSDADVLTHAICDSLLGAAALGDIGTHFPDTDIRYKDADSIHLLVRVAEIVRSAGYSIINVDSTVVMQRPRLRPYINEMRLRLAEALGIAVDRVSVKATTTEGLGYVGAGAGAAAYAVSALEETEDLV